MSRRLVLAAALLAVGALPAQLEQGAQAPHPDAQRRDLLRRQSQSDHEVQRLLDMRLRHDLGLLGELDDAMIRTAEASTSTVIDRRRTEVDEENAKTQILQVEYEKLRRAVERLQAMAAATAEGEGDGELLTVPQPGRRVSRPSTGAPRRTGAPNQPPAAPGPESVARGPGVVDGALALDPLRAHIHGSKDHQRVAQALFKAGQALMDRAQELRDRGDVEGAATLDARAQERLVRAVEELQPLLSAEEPAFVTLFYLGRCRELLFRYSERYEDLSLVASDREYRRRETEVREPFLAIASRDVQVLGEGGATEVLGPWGQAAKTAMEHFRWMNVNARFDAMPQIEALTWPGLERGEDGQ